MGLISIFGACSKQAEKDFGETYGHFDWYLRGCGIILSRVIWHNRSRNNCSAFGKKIKHVSGSEKEIIGNGMNNFASERLQGLYKTKLCEAVVYRTKETTAVGDRR